MQLPSFMGGKPMAREEDDNVRRLRDEQPTRPHRFEHNPPPPPPSPWTSGHYGPKPSTGTAREMDVARAMAEDLLTMDMAARTRVIEHVEFMLTMYGTKDDTPPEVTGAAV